MKVIIIFTVNLIIVCECIKIQANNKFETTFRELKYVPQTFAQIDSIEKKELSTEFVIKHISQQQNHYRDNGNIISFYAYGYFDFWDNRFFLYEKTDGYNTYIYICYYSDYNYYPKTLLIYQNNSVNFHIIDGVIYIISINGNTEFPSLTAELYKLDSSFSFLKKFIIYRKFDENNQKSVNWLLLSNIQKTVK